jgi:Fungal Zn(2)-Cys(6) binuclear cluster domain/Fungal specific transcription factor domain
MTPRRASDKQDAYNPGLLQVPDDTSLSPEDSLSNVSSPSLGSMAIKIETAEDVNARGGGSLSKLTKRRPHSKSRRGCATCKRRRVKCDETHPKCKNCEHLGLECSFSVSLGIPTQGGINMVDLRLFYHYTSVVWKTISQAGISNDQIWGQDVPMMAFEYPCLMHAILTFSASHLSRMPNHNIQEYVITIHRGDALRLLRQEVQQVSPQNLDALVAAAILLILDSLANASLPEEQTPSSLPASAWLRHVRGAATILLSVAPLPAESRFFKLVNIDLSDLAATSLMVESLGFDPEEFSSLECFDDEISDLYPVKVGSPYFQTLMYIDKLYHQRTKPDFILRVFSLPAFLDRDLIALIIKGDDTAGRIIKVYYKMVRAWTAEAKDKVWFIEGVAKVLPIDMDSEYGGLGFITQALPVADSIEAILASFDASIMAADDTRAKVAASFNGIADDNNVDDYESMLDVTSTN